MPALRVVTVKSSSGDYSSLSSAEALEQADLAALDRQLDIECHQLGDTSGIAINGWTTDATRYLRIYVAPSQHHLGVLNAAKCNLNITATGIALTVSEDYVRVEGLQIRNTNTASPASIGRMVFVNSTANDANSDIRFTDCIITAPAATATGSNYGFECWTGKVTITNCIVYDIAGIGVNTGGATVSADNCTLVGGTYGAGRTSGSLTLRNCYASGGTDAYNGTITRTTCAHSSATVFAGSTASVAHSTANFTNVTAGSEDYHLVSGSALIDQGTDLSGTFTTDIDGVARSGTWDIGADEYTSVVTFKAAWASGSNVILCGSGF